MAKRPQPTVITANPKAVATNATCNGASTGSVALTVNASGGTGTLTSTYAWTGPGGFTSTSQNLTNVAAGTYNVTITVTDANGCVKTFTLGTTVTDPAPITAAPNGVPTHAGCNGAATGGLTLTVNASGGTGFFTLPY